jgi:hypothetical protein
MGCGNREFELMEFHNYEGAGAEEEEDEGSKV